jgi:FixJ family two-component response regulator
MSAPVTRKRRPKRRPRPLTELECAVVSRLARGFIGHEIADDMDVSIHTVNSWAARARGKLGARNVAHAVILHERVHEKCRRFIRLVVGPGS